MFPLIFLASFFAPVMLMLCCYALPCLLFPCVALSMHRSVTFASSQTAHALF
jgi:fumarate reductase subunit D